ncbi:MAG: molecular chaperone DnaJ [Pseudomonadota bacterium]|nr:molecular chaperone DnaJ [Pseudomonadota bacterium]
MEQKQDYYEALGVNKQASEGDIKKAYRRMAMKYHPDRNPDDKQAEATFKYINEAYDVLSDQEKRSMYDQYGHAGINNAGAGGTSGGFDFNGSDIFGDIFEQFMGGQNPFGGRSKQKPRGHDLSYRLDLTLEEAIKGVEKEIKFKANVKCDTCDGQGAENPNDVSTCTTCNGTGQVRIQQGFISLQQTCHHCHGTGKTIKNPCKTCHGKGHVHRQKTLKINIPKGIDEGNRVRMSGEGEFAGPGSIPGDLFVEIHIKPHDIFKRNGNDLHCEMPIQFADAALGNELTIPTIDGKVSIKIPPETQTGATFRLRGKGVQGYGKNYAGDLICKVLVETPTRLNNDQKQLLKQFQDAIDNDSTRHAQKKQRWTDKVKSFFQNMGVQ